MLENTTGSTSLFSPEDIQPTLKMKKNDRMGGSVPVWSKATTVKEQTSAKLAQALADPGIQGSPFQLALADVNGPSNPSGEKPFGFGDLVDMVNPLHHIPIVGMLYREITGDEIRGAGKVMGGAIFGGPVGAGSSLFNVVVEHDQGEDIPGMAMNFVKNEILEDKDKNRPNAPQDRLNAAIEAYSYAPREPISDVKF